MSQEEVAEKVGKSRSAVANSLRLLNLDDRVQKMIHDNKLSGGHARALLGLNDSARQAEIAEKIIENGMSVRATENLVKTLNNAKPVEIRPSTLMSVSINPLKKI